MNPLYAGVCGITHEELHTTLRLDVERLAKALGKTIDETYAKLAFQYDGYHTCKNSPDIYSPFSLVNALNDCELKNYWFGSATPTMLVKYMRKMDFTFDLSRLDGAEVKEGSFNIPLEEAHTPLPILYQSGYLTIRSYDDFVDMYTLCIPNNDVRIGLSDSLLPMVSRQAKEDNDMCIARFKRAIASDDTATAKQLLYAYLAGIPCDILKDKGEHTYHAIFYALFSLLGFPPKIENGSARGYSDMVFQTQTSVYCIEFKVDQSAEKAIRPIIDKGYLEPYLASGKRLVMVGVNFSTAERNITEWVEQEFGVNM